MTHEKDELIAEKIKIIDATDKKKTPGYPLIGILTILVFISLVGTYMNSTMDRSRAKAAAEANCLTSDATNRVLVEVIGELTAPRILGPSATPKQISFQEEENRKAVVKQYIGRR